MKQKSIFAVALLLFLAAQRHSLAGSATWATNPIGNDWNTAQNWMPNTVPDGPGDSATFAASDITDLSLTGNIEVDSIHFDSGANPFTITIGDQAFLNFTGTGVVNDSGTVQTFTQSFAQFHTSTILFFNSATAGDLTVFDIPGGAVTLEDSASAGTAKFTISGADFAQGNLLFVDDSTAAEATIETIGFAITIFDGNSTAANAVFTTIGGGVVLGVNSTAANGVFTCSDGGAAEFTGFATAAQGQFTASGAATSSDLACFIDLSDDTTAGDASFVINGGSAPGAPAAVMTFFERATAGNATLTMNGGTAGGAGGTLLFHDESDGGTASLALFDNGNLDLGKHKPTVVTVGSLEGNGQVFLGARALAVGSNNRSTAFSGVIQDGEVSLGRGGSLTKVGTGTLALSGANTYTGGTTVSSGRLVINNTADSSTGTGAAQVNAGTLAGQGTMAGAVTIGSGSGTGAVLAPGLGAARAATLTLQSNLTCKADATYTYRLNTKKGRSDQVIANGVTIESGAQFNFQAIGRGRLRVGTVFTAISNTSANLISGVFANLPDGSTLTAGSNTLQVSYTGGDGNDLTLTVVR